MYLYIKTASVLFVVIFGKGLAMIIWKIINKRSAIRNTVSR